MIVIIATDDPLGNEQRARAAENIVVRLVAAQITRVAVLIDTCQDSENLVVRENRLILSVQTTRQRFGKIGHPLAQLKGSDRFHFVSYPIPYVLRT